MRENPCLAARPGETVVEMPGQTRLGSCSGVVARSRTLTKDLDKLQVGIEDHHYVSWCVLAHMLTNSSGSILAFKW